MPSNVRSIAHRTEAGRILAAADAVRDADCIDADDVADLLKAIGKAMHTIGHPALSETELWRWSGTVGVARRLASKFVPR